MPQAWLDAPAGTVGTGGDGDTARAQLPGLGDDEAPAFGADGTAPNVACSVWDPARSEPG